MPRGTDRYDEARLQGRLWTPALTYGTSSLLAWYDSDPSTITGAGGGLISQWNDKSGRGRHATQATGGSQPSWVTSRPKSVVNIPSGKMFDLSAMPTQFDCVAVFKLGTANNYWRVLMSTTAQYIGMKENGSNRWGGHNGSFVSSGYSINPSAVTLARVRIDGSRNYYTSLDGQPLVSIFTLSAGFSITKLGNQSNDGAMFTNDLYEVLFVDNQTTAAMDRMDGYLAWKWNIVGNLLASSPFKNRPPLIGD